MPILERQTLYPIDGDVEEGVAHVTQNIKQQKVKVETDDALTPPIEIDLWVEATYS